jgi:hypothetical protein
MKALALALALLAGTAFADDDAGLIATIPLADGGSLVVPVTPAGPTIGAAPTSLDNPTAYAKIIFHAVKDGDWWTAAAALLTALVALIRAYGKKLKDWAAIQPNLSIIYAPLHFLFDTKPGGWALNFATSLGGGVGFCLMSGEPVTWALVKPILVVSFTGSALWELAGDVMDWMKAKQPVPPAAALAVVAPAIPPVEPPKP